jgi:hypothetical protein
VRIVCFAVPSLLAPQLRADAGGVLRQLADKCKAASQYQFEADLSVVRKCPGARDDVLARARVRVASGGRKYVIEVHGEGEDAYLHVSDGRKKWMYMPKLKRQGRRNGRRAGTGRSEI